MPNIYIYGTGNMAWALANALKSQNITISGFFGRTPAKVLEMAEHFQVPVIESLEAKTSTGDFVFLAVKDDALPVLNESLRLQGRLVLHMAGSVSMASISAISDRTGVFYPLQRVRKYTHENFKSIPICIEAINKNDVEQLQDLGKIISGNVILMDSEVRQKVHIAAIFISNFTNFMFVLGGDLLKKNELPSSILDALVNDVKSEINLLDAYEKQTGPARRGDLKVIKEHLKLLGDTPNVEEIYKLLSVEIMKYFNV